MRRPRLIDTGPSGIRNEMMAMGVDPAGIDIMQGKSRHLLIRLDEIELRAALILKQDMLSLGGDAALRREAAGLTVKTTPVLLMGTIRQLRGLAGKLVDQPFKLSGFSGAIGQLLDALDTAPRYLVHGADLLEGGRTAVVGILNVTEDSFSDGGRYADRDSAVARGLEMTAQGAHVIDVGGESTRPGSRPVSVEEELERVIPVIRDLAAEGVKNISVDTTKSLVASKALEAGAAIINDISGMTYDANMLSVAREGDASVILMHTRGKPENMQDDLSYDDLMGEVCRYLESSLNAAVDSGIPPERICIDPGIGFGKSLEQNIQILSRIGELRSYGTAVMVGASRKSFIGGLTGAAPEDRGSGSVGAAAAAVLRGADMVRVHDVAETVQAMTVISRIKAHVQW